MTTLNIPVDKKKAGDRDGGTKKSGSDTGDRTRGLWFCAPVL